MTTTQQVNKTAEEIFKDSKANRGRPELLWKNMFPETKQMWRIVARWHLAQVEKIKRDLRKRH